MPEEIVEKMEKKKLKRWFVVLIIETIAFGLITGLKMYAAYDSVLFLAGYSVTTLLPFYLLQLVVISVLCAKTLEDNKKYGMLGAMTIGALPFMMNVILILVVFSAIWIPGLTIKRKPQALEKAHHAITVVMTVFLALLLALPPHNFVSFSVGQGTKSSQKYWDEFIEGISTISIDEIKIGSYNSKENYGTPRNYILTEQLRDQIATILKESPVEYYYQNSKGATPSSSLHISIRIWKSESFTNATFWYDYENKQEYYEEEGKTFITLGTDVNKITTHSYFTMANRYMDKIFALLQDYEIDETMFIQFRNDITSAKAGEFSVSVVLEGDTYPVIVEQAALDRIGEIFNNYYVDFTHFENSNDFPTGNIDTHIVMRDCDTTLDIIYDFRRSGENEQSAHLGTEGRSLIRICARGETEYYLMPNFVIDEFMHELGLYEPEETE